MLGLSFNQDKLPDFIERLVFDGCVPSFFGVARLCPSHFFHDKLPGAFDKSGITVLQINLGNLKVDGRLLAGFIQSVEEAFCLRGIRGVETITFAVETVEGVINAVFTAEDAVALFHGSFWLYRASHNSDPTG